MIFKCEHCNGSVVANSCGSICIECGETYRTTAEAQVQERIDKLKDCGWELIAVEKVCEDSWIIVKKLDIIRTEILDPLRSFSYYYQDDIFDFADMLFYKDGNGIYNVNGQILNKVINLGKNFKNEKAR